MKHHKNVEDLNPCYHLYHKHMFSVSVTRIVAYFWSNKMTFNLPTMSKMLCDTRYNMTAGR